MSLKYFLFPTSLFLRILYCFVAIFSSVFSVSSLHAQFASDPTPVSPSFLGIIGAAFLGGLLLNLMPCVFPVLSIKILGFVEKAGKSPQLVRNHGFAFAFGVVASFWALALIIRGLKETGEKLGWGFQLQNPAFVAFLILLLVAVALNFFGVFDFGASLQSGADKLQRNTKGYYASFLNGVLATVLATPCTAPFMGGALAYGLSSSFLKSIAVFTVLGLGLAAPYLFLTFFPAALSKLPKPGAWMDTFKQVMGFPVLLTALWLLTVFEKQRGVDAVMLLLLAVILLSFALWLYSKLFTVSASRARRNFALFLLMLLLVGVGYIGIPFSESVSSPVSDASRDSNLVKNEFESPVSEGSAASYKSDKYGVKWLEYNPDLMNDLLDKNRAVFIDFTAAWCVTCQVNKKVIFGTKELRELFAKKDVVLVRADWTNEDPIITDALASFNKAGVPLNVLYNPKERENPKIFPALLSKQVVEEALKALP